ncbi:hypothetical protein KKB71_02430 [Patescibacteria group bacterium]|nr:hypothetical protein [Patescibacteria group bacterium]MBU2219030.1 hypothetical protein [Patescibacteria group bacterium]
MNYKKLIGWGILFYVAAFVIMSVFVAFEKSDWIVAKLVTIAAIAVIAYLAGRNISASSMIDALKYSVVWAIIVAIFDFLICTRFVPDIFFQWNIWVGYALIILVPLLTVKKGASVPTQQPQQTQRPVV